MKEIFFPRNKDFDPDKVPGHTIHFGMIKDGDDVLDEVLLSIFRKPHSYTGEDSIEISCHGSPYIQERILHLLIRHGIRQAQRGEFTLRAFRNGKFDLSQAEAVADLVAANSSSSHQLAISQMRGGYSEKIRELRKKLIHFASLIELELDFSEEDVEFANRTELDDLLREMKAEITRLIESFAHGNVLKSGIPVAIIGKPNTGKSTLLNAILNEEKAIVSDIPGTTRDAIEDTIVLEGIAFRFVDTAGLRYSEDRIESMGIERTFEKIRQSRIILYLFDVSENSCETVLNDLDAFRNEMIEKIGLDEWESKTLIIIGNKIDKLVEIPRHFRDFVEMKCLFVSAKRKENLAMISDSLLEAVKADHPDDSIMVSNTRHYEAFTRTLAALDRVMSGFAGNVPTDLITIDLRDALHNIGEVTGEVTTEEILQNIFGSFCIGK